MVQIQKFLLNLYHSKVVSKISWKVFFKAFLLKYFTSTLNIQFLKNNISGILYRYHSCGYATVISLIYGCCGIVWTLKHRCTGVYPGVKFMGLAFHCLTMFLVQEECVWALHSAHRRCEILSGTRCVSDRAPTG